MADNVFSFRRLKWGDPDRKLQMLPGGDARPALGSGAMNAFKSIASNIGLLLIAASVGFAGVYSFTGDNPIAGQAFAMISDECNIKGNISMRSGERIYHVPGQMYYRDTTINWAKGERWFCSEDEARAAGWRRSQV